MAGADVERRRHRPAGVVGPVGLARDVRLDRGQPVVVERERRIDVRADHALRLVVEPVDQRVGVAEPFLGDGVAQHARVQCADRGAPPERRVRARPGVADRDQAGDDRPPVHDERAPPVREAAEDRDVGDRLGGQPVRGGRVAPDRRLPVRGPAQRVQRPVTGAGDDAQPVGAVVGGQREQRDRPVVGEVRVAPLGGRAAVVAAVVAEPAVGLRHGRCAPARRDDPVDRRAVPAGRVDDQVGGEVAAVGAHADDPRHGGPARRDQARHPHPAPDRRGRACARPPRHGRLDHRTPGRHRVEPLVARPPPAGDVGGPLVQHVGAGGPRGQHGRRGRRAARRP